MGLGPHTPLSSYSGNGETAFPTGSEAPQAAPPLWLGPPARTHLAGLQGAGGASGRASAGSAGWLRSAAGPPAPPTPGCR